MILLYAQFCHSQQTLITSGGNISTTTGSSSFSVGQVFFLSSSSNKGQVSQGVQQSFEILTLSNSELQTVNLKAIAYPNPTTDKIILNIEESELNDFSFQLFDVKGQLLSKKIIKNKNTNIPFDKLSNGIYLLKISKNATQLKTFKIIKK